ncbi:hypothetical protein [Alloyangia pacifica]|uniref:Uncharacterized protein n=1 Tax=Alloyangia pacifica TaxID=311180 RepID=A0A1I6RJK9_9RHOB|nr:hypothetical protein [Alloyangia pacifica]SDG52348.1 hypothetical protein SAMN04488245_103138 [Alloyangia pacifica]SFS64897.1 hypothetical protein SAMN04488050_103138 [Alloyangia pacifica]
MHVLPVGLPVLLPGMVALEAAKLKLQLNAAVSDRLREAMSRHEVTCYARLHFDTRGGFKTLTISLERLSAEDFEVMLSWDTFGLLRYRLEEQVVAAYLNCAVNRRLKWGRELAHLDDEALEALRLRCHSRIGSDRLSNTHLQEAFLGRLADAEVAERQRDGSKHRRLQAIKQAKPLQELLEAERADAELDGARHPDLNGSNYYGVAAKAPEETRKIYDYRAYHAERREGFPLFDIWGEPWPKRGRPRRVAPDGQEVAKAG